MISKLNCSMSSIEEIERHLLDLGAGNHKDNMVVMREFPHHFRVTLPQDIFMNLVFLQTSIVGKIVPSNEDRTLGTVAQRALSLGKEETNLGPNWNISEAITRFDNQYPPHQDVVLTALVLRESRGSELRWGPWYLQDGSHRALAYCMAILSGKFSYVPQGAFCAANKLL